MRNIPIVMIAFELMTQTAMVHPALVSQSTVHAADGPVSINQPQSPADWRLLVEKTISALDATTLIERSRAERALLDLGPEVLPYLPSPDVIKNAQSRDTVKRVRVQLERRAARESALASRVTLEGDFTLGDAIQQISRQTPNKVQISRPSGTHSQAFDFTAAPFWEVIDTICKQQGLEIDLSHGATSVLLVPQKPDFNPELAIQRTGPFRISIDTAVVRPVIGETERQLVRVSGKIAVEPRLRPLFLHFATADITARHSALGPLTAWNPGAKYEQPVGDAGRVVPIQFEFVLPGPDSNRVNLETTGVSSPTMAIQGRVLLQLAAATERIVFDKTAQIAGASRRRGGVTVKLRDVKFESVEKSDPTLRIDGEQSVLQCEIGVAVSYDTGGPAFESHRTWMFHNAVYLETEKGERIDFTDYDTLQQADGGVAVSYRWSKLAGPATRFKFIYEAPTLILDVPIEVELPKIVISRK